MLTGLVESCLGGQVKLFFLLSVFTVMSQSISCHAYFTVQVKVTCCLCGQPLTSDEIHVNLVMHKTKSQFICEECQLRGKDKEASGVSFFRPLSDSFFMDLDLTDHFYEDKEARKSIDEALWEFSSDDFKKQRKVRAGQNRVKIFYKKKKKEKVDKKDFLLSHPKIIVIAKDGYLYFDKEKSEYFFSQKKEDFFSYIARKEFNFEFKILLKDDSVVLEKDVALEKIFASCRQNIDKAFEVYQEENQKRETDLMTMLKESSEKLERL